MFAAFCTKCKESFAWHTSDLSQICAKCKKEAGGGFHKIFEEVNDPDYPGYAGRFLFIPFNKAETVENAINLLVEKDGLNRNNLKIK